MQRGTIISTVLMILSTLNTQAQTEDKSTTLNPVVITGTGTYHKANNSPVAVKVISAKELCDAQVTSLQEALNRLTTNITTHTNGMGTFVNFNGISDDYILILENGKRVSGDDRWDRISVQNIKRIEIYRGAASALYGSDALAGVINIITEESKNHMEASSSSKLMSKGRFSEDINLDITQGKLSSFTSYNHRQANNWQVNHYQQFMEGDEEVLKLTGRPMSTGFSSENISQKFEWRFNDKWSVYVRGNYYDNLTHRPQNATYFSQNATTDQVTGEKSYSYTEKTAYTYNLHHQSYTYGGGARWTPNQNIHIYLDIYSDNFSSKYNYWQTSEREAYTETRKRTHYTNETLKGIFRLANWNKLSAGMEFVQESLNSESDNIDHEATDTYNFFAQDEAQIVKGLEAIVGVRYTYNNNFDSNVTGSAGLFYHIGGFRVRVNYAGGYRTPTLSQLYATDQAKTNARYTLSNPNLNPEKNDFWNANVEYSNSWMSIGVSGFINKIRDMINYRTITEEEIAADAHLTDLQNDGWSTIRQRDNIDHATLRGISANVKFLLPHGVTIGGGYTFTDSEAKSKVLNKKTQEYEISKSPVDKSVKHVGNVNASWDHTWKSYHLNINLVGHIQGPRYSRTYGYADRYSQWDINTRHSFTLRQCTLEPGIGIENLLNKRDRAPWNSNYSTISPGRSAYISFAIKLKD